MPCDNDSYPLQRKISDLMRPQQKLNCQNALGVFLALCFLVLPLKAYSQGALESSRLDTVGIYTHVTGGKFEGFYTSDGIKFSETYAEDGTLLYRDERENLTGHWSIENDLFCNRYTKPVGGCFALYRHSENCILSFSAPDDNAPYSPAEDEVPGVYMWNVEKPSTCPTQQLIS